MNSLQRISAAALGEQLACRPPLESFSSCPACLLGKQLPTQLVPSLSTAPSQFTAPSRGTPELSHVSCRSVPIPTESSLSEQMRDSAVQVVDERRFVNHLPDPCSPDQGLGREERDGRSPTTQREFLEAGLATARRAIDGLESAALAREGPFLYTGLLGAALLCLRCHEARELSGREGGEGAGGAGDLERAEAIVRKCEKAAARGREYFSFFTGQPGIHSVGAAISSARGDRAATQRHLSFLAKLARDPRLSLTADQLTELEAGSPEAVDELAVAPGGVPHELLYGRTGFLWAVVSANEACSRNGMEDLCVPLEFLNPIAASVVAAGRAMAKDDVATRRRSTRGRAAPGEYPPLMYEWHRKRYWGAAHGLMGILHVLLLAHQAGVRLAPAVDQGRAGREQEESRCLDDLRATLLYMVSHQFASGNFPTSEENGDDCRVHWCHGAPGAALTLAHFAKAFLEEPTFLAAAESASDAVWSRGLLRRTGLCHGISGNAYSFLALSRVPGARAGYTLRARAFGSFLLDHQERLVAQGLMHPGDSPFSLMEGLAGPACLFLDLANPEAARFPGYEL